MDELITLRNNIDEIDDSIFPNEMQIDFVRIYQK